MASKEDSLKFKKGANLKKQQPGAAYEAGSSTSSAAIQQEFDANTRLIVASVTQGGLTGLPVVSEGVSVSDKVSPLLSPPPPPPLPGPSLPSSVAGQDCAPKRTVISDHTKTTPCLQTGGLSIDPGRQLVTPSGAVTSAPPGAAHIGAQSVSGSLTQVSVDQSQVFMNTPFHPAPAGSGQGSAIQGWPGQPHVNRFPTDWSSQILSLANALGPKPPQAYLPRPFYGPRGLAAPLATGPLYHQVRTCPQPSGFPLPNMTPPFPQGSQDHAGIGDQSLAFPQPVSLTHQSVKVSGDGLPQGHPEVHPQGPHGGNGKEESRNGPRPLSGAPTTPTQTTQRASLHNSQQVGVVSPSAIVNTSDDRLSQMEAKIGQLTDILLHFTRQSPGLGDVPSSKATEKVADLGSQTSSGPHTSPGLGQVRQVGAVTSLPFTGGSTVTWPSSQSSQSQVTSALGHVSSAQVSQRSAKTTDELLAELLERGVPLDAHSQSSSRQQRESRPSLPDLTASNGSPHTFRMASHPPTLSPYPLASQPQGVTDKQSPGLPRSVTRPIIHPNVHHQAALAQPELSEDPLSDEVLIHTIPDSQDTRPTTAESLQSVLQDLEALCPDSISTQTVQTAAISALDRMVNRPTASVTHHLVGGESVQAFLNATFREPTPENPLNELLSKKGNLVQPSKKKLVHQRNEKESYLAELPIPEYPTEISSSDLSLKSANMDKATAESKLGISLSNKAVKLQERLLRDAIMEFSVAEGLFSALREASLQETVDAQGATAWEFSDLEPELFNRVSGQFVKIFANLSSILGTLYANTMLQKRDTFLFHQTFDKACQKLKPKLRQDPLVANSLFANHTEEISDQRALQSQRSQIEGVAVANQSLIHLSKLAKAQTASSSKVQPSAPTSSSRGRGRSGRGGHYRGTQRNSSFSQHSKGRGRGRGGAKRSAPSSTEGPVEKKQRF